MAEYINRTALLFAMDDYFHGTDPDGEEQIGVLKMRRLVRTFDAADVAPVVHARWVQGKGNLWTCSRCGAMTAAAPNCTPITEDQEFFCYKCGAKMDEEETDNE